MLQCLRMLMDMALHKLKERFSFTRCFITSIFLASLIYSILFVKSKEKVQVSFSPGSLLPTDGYRENRSERSESAENETRSSTSITHFDNQHIESGKIGDPRMAANKTKVIIHWLMLTRPFSVLHPEYETMFSTCEYSDCMITEDRTMLDEASMLLFHATSRPEFPEKRYPWQLYVHLSLESPKPGARNPIYDGLLNLSSTYRKDSDLPIPYGAIEELPVPFEYNLRIPLSQKNKSVVWMVSHCKAASGRDEYVHELSKYIDVDIIGRCGQDIFPKFNYTLQDCYKIFDETYKFYLSFENTFCTDYFTEKLVNILGRHDMIPIVLGAANYTRDAPPHSVIDIRDFNTPKNLANYLHQLSQNEVEYNKYFEWRGKYRMRPIGPWCSLCKYLHNSSYSQGGTIRPKYLEKFSDWWDGSCDNSVIPKMRERGNW